MDAIVSNIMFEDMEKYLYDTKTRIVDSRMLESYYNFGFSLQVLNPDGTIYQVEVVPKIVSRGGREVMENPDQFRKDALDLFRLQYRNNPRNNPGLYGLLD